MVAGANLSHFVIIKQALKEAVFSIHIKTIEPSAEFATKIVVLITRQIQTTWYSKSGAKTTYTKFEERVDYCYE